MNSQSTGRWSVGGYWFGGTLCFLGLLALSLGLLPLLKSVRNKPAMVPLPGESEFTLRLPGAYVAVMPGSDMTPYQRDKLHNMDIEISPKNEKDSIPIVKIPPQNFVSDKKEEYTPLFQFAVDEPGQYVIHSRYPFEVEGPKVTAVMFHVDLRYVRTQLIVGLLVCLLLVGVGVYLVVKTYRTNNPKIKTTPRPPKGKKT